MDSDDAIEKTATQITVQPPSTPGLNEAERSPSSFRKRVLAPQINLSWHRKIVAITPFERKQR
jgi:hypothetical protein